MSRLYRPTVEARSPLSTLGAKIGAGKTAPYGDGDDQKQGEGPAPVAVDGDAEARFGQKATLKTSIDPFRRDFKKGEASPFDRLFEVEQASLETKRPPN